jgi:MGT family glycosyltransferase
MATFLITTLPLASHTLPMLSLAEALVKRGHRVLFHTGENDNAKVQAAGAELVPMSEHCNFAYRLENPSAPLPKWVPEFVRGFLSFRNEILRMIPCMVGELEVVMKQEQVDCLVGDYLGFGASYAAERLDIPFVTLTMGWTVTMNANAIPLFISSIPLPPRIIHALIDFIFPLSRVRKQMGLPQRPKNAPAEFFSVVVSKLLNLVTFPKEFIPSERLQENQVFIGPTAFQMPSTTEKQPFGTNLEPGTVLVSTTTSGDSGDMGLFRQMLESIAQMGIPILATSASATDIPAGLGENVRLETFVPFDEVLPYVRALVTHGGTGSVGRALKYGVPMLIISSYGETVNTGRQAAQLGLAYHLPKNKATPKAIRSTLQALLQDHALHTRVKALSEKMLSIDSQELAAKSIESILHSEKITVGLHK